MNYTLYFDYSQRHFDEDDGGVLVVLLPHNGI